LAYASVSMTRRQREVEGDDRAAAIDAGTGAELVRQGLVHADALYHLARYLTRSRTDAEDLVQETYTRAFAAHDQFAPGTNLKAWLFKILRNACIDLARRRQVVDAAGPPPEPAVASWDADVRGALAHEIEEALGTLPEPARTVVLLDLEGLTEVEAAAVLGCPVGTIKSRLARARAALREKLRDYGSTR
jgi:RNA polymerase sigma-70 factor, ECF subfamily